MTSGDPEGQIFPFASKIQLRYMKFPVCSLKHWEKTLFVDAILNEKWGHLTTMRGASDTAKVMASCVRYM